LGKLDTSAAAVGSDSTRVAEVASILTTPERNGGDAGSVQAARPAYSLPWSSKASPVSTPTASSGPNRVRRPSAVTFQTWPRFQPEADHVVRPTYSTPWRSTARLSANDPSAPRGKVVSTRAFETVGACGGGAAAAAAGTRPTARTAASPVRRSL